MRPATLKPAELLFRDKPHGTRTRYLAGCRCTGCRIASTRYTTLRAEAVRRGEWNGLVDATPAIAHLKKLSRHGVGFKTAADAASVGRTTLSLILSGSRARMRAQSMQRLMAVTPAAIADHGYVPAERTWRMIRELLEEGFTRMRIARELGMKTPELQLGRKRVLAATQLAVEKLWRRYMLDAPHAIGEPKSSRRAAAPVEIDMDAAVGRS